MQLGQKGTFVVVCLHICFSWRTPGTGPFIVLQKQTPTQCPLWETLQEQSCLGCRSPLNSPVLQDCCRSPPFVSFICSFKCLFIEQVCPNTKSWPVPATPSMLGHSCLQGRHSVSFALVRMKVQLCPDLFCILCVFLHEASHHKALVSCSLSHCDQRCPHLWV